MKTFTFKVDDTISEELNLIKEIEGLGNSTSAFIYLVKHYYLTKKNSLDQSLALLGKALDTIDLSTLPSPEEQLKDI